MKNCTFMLALLFFLTSSGCQAPIAISDPLEGAWKPIAYHLKSGESHSIDGSIFFHDGRWLVLFYVLDSDGNPVRGSAEGGSYSTSGDRLSLSHLSNLSSGEALPGLEASQLSMVLHKEGEGTPEECIYRIEGDRLTIDFPSGNSMQFTRFPGS